MQRAAFLIPVLSGTDVSNYIMFQMCLLYIFFSNYGFEFAVTLVNPRCGHI